MSSDDLQRAVQFFTAQLRNVNPSPSKLRRWTGIKLRTDTDALARLMLAEGYRATYLRYFIRYHIPRLREALETRDGQHWQINEAVITVLADIRDAAKRLPQPYRDLAAVCLKWGYVHQKVIQTLAEELEREGKNDSEQRS
jgi:hypothetical protein